MDNIDKSNYKLMLFQAHKITEEAREDVRLAKSVLEKICNDNNDLHRYEAGNALCKIREREFDRKKNYKFSNNIDSQIAEFARIRQLLKEIDISRVTRIVEMWNPSNEDLIPFRDRQVELLEELNNEMSLNDDWKK